MKKAIKPRLHRKDFIIDVVNHFGFKSYLEIGLRDRTSVFDHIPCKVKYSVDPDPKARAHYVGTSDAFFAQPGIKNVKWDVIFIDACHLAAFVYNDIMNSLNHLNEGGVIFLHDVLPISYEHTTELTYCQTAWKVVPYILKYHEELRICSIAENTTGMGIVVRGVQDRKLDPEFNKFYDYYLMDKNRQLSQNVIQYSQMLSWIKGTP